MNVKEQGRLLRQDNFTVWTGKKKHQRRVFLQDDLVIFSKVRKQPGGVDLYYYKNSIKVAKYYIADSYLLQSVRCFVSDGKHVGILKA